MHRRRCTKGVWVCKGWRPTRARPSGGRTQHAGGRPTRVRGHNARQPLPLCRRRHSLELYLKAYSGAQRPVRAAWWESAQCKDLRKRLCQAEDRGVWAHIRHSNTNDYQEAMRRRAPVVTKSVRLTSLDTSPQCAVVLYVGEFVNSSAVFHSRPGPVHGNGSALVSFVSR